jgi:hypothetical protein
MKKLLILLQLSLAVSLSAQQREPPPKSEDRISGTVEKVVVAKNGQDATITIQSGSGHIRRNLVFTAATAITYQGKSSTLSEVKKPRKLDCLGSFHDQQFEARSCTVQ